MKKNLFFLVCLLAAANALFAQPLPILHPDSSRFIRQSNSVVLNAPFIFKAEKIAEKVVRNERDEAIVVQKLRILDVFKGDLKVNDTLEFSWNAGWVMWNENGRYSFPIHAYQPDVYWGDRRIPTYYFCKQSALKPFFPGSKSRFVLYSETPFSIASFQALEERNPDMEYILIFNNRLNFHKEANFLNYLNKLLTPKPITTPSEHIKAIKKTRKLKRKTRKQVGFINQKIKAFS
jgi:hypothetical protein